MTTNLIKHPIVQRFSRIFVVGVLILGYVAVIPASPKAHAGTLAKVFVRLDSLVASATNVPVHVCFQADVATSIKSIRITFPTTNGATDYALTTSPLSNYTSNNTVDTVPGTQVGITGLAANPSSVTAKTITFDDSGGFVPSTTANNYSCFGWTSVTNGLTNPAAWTTESVTGTVETFSATGASGLISSASFSEPKTVTTNGTNVNVTATVPPSFSFTLNGTSDPFGTINIAAVNFTAGLQATVVTNAGSGWIIWARSTGNASCSKGCIYSPSKNYFVQSSAAVGSAAANIATGAEHYDFSTTAKSLGPSGACTTLTQTTFFDGITNAGWGGPLDKTTFYPIAYCNGSSTAATVNFREAFVAIASTEAANDYADTIIMTAAGNF
jgi:hypothetical protein